MRRFTYASGSSHKFWEIDRTGTQVTVRFGRTGTAGQTQVKDLGSDEAAEAHVEKLVAQKLKKGYAEEPAGSGPPESPAPEAPAAATPTATPAKAPTAAPTADPAPASAPELPDEDTLVFPEEWAGLVHHRRGGYVVPVLDPDPEDAWRLVAEQSKVIDALIGKLSSPTFAEQVRAYRADRAGTPLGAAGLAVITAHALRWDRSDEVRTFVDAWIAADGIDFAARAVMERLSLYVLHNGDVQVGRGRGGLGAATDALSRRLRTRLAVATRDEFDTAVATLAAYRNTDHNLVDTTYLVPGRDDWLAEAAAVVPEGRVIPSEHMNSLDQLMAYADGVIAYDEATVATVLDGIGPAVAPVLAKRYDRDPNREMLAALAAIPTDEAFDLLVRRVEKKFARHHVREAMRRFPVRAARRLTALGATELLREHVRDHGALLAAADLPDNVRAAVAAAAAALAPVPEATELPAYLAAPPWTVKKPVVKPTVIAGLTATVTPAVVWREGERDAWAARRGSARWYGRKDHHEAAAEFHAGKLDTEMHGPFFGTAPAKLAAPFLATWRPSVTWALTGWLPAIAARHELAALPALLHAADQSATSVAEYLVPFGDAEVATRMADWASRLKSLRDTTHAWFERHPEIAARALVPAALGKPGKARRAAEHGLRLIDPDIAAKAAAEHGEEAAAAIAAIHDTDPLDALHARIPKLPAWLTVEHLPQLVLREGGALPRTAVEHVITTFALSKADEVHPGVDIVGELCTPESLADFTWAVFRAWQAADMPAKESWALDALGWFGDDDTVRRLTPLIRAWPGESGHARAVAGLEVLAAIGTDVALMHLHGIAQRVKFTGLRAKAQEKIAQVAEGLGLTPDQLADRLVPDLGLDEDGSMVLDYGPRRFTVGFDERLVPYVLDETGTRRKDLPKPGARDDQELAPAAHKRFAALKKDVRALAADQVRRLEQAMVTGRRWTSAEFTDLFVAHPLLRHVVRRLVWATFDEEGTTALTFRVAEDRTLADVTDDTTTLPADALVGVVHPLHLDPGDLAGWAEIFADYEILQPFPQLSRPVHALTDEELTATELTAFAGATAATGAVLGLTNRGWRRGEPQDAGVECWVLRPLEDDHAVVVDLDPGIAVGSIDVFPEQKIERVWLSGDGEYWRSRGVLPFGELTAVEASEVLADLTALTGVVR